MKRVILTLLLLMAALAGSGWCVGEAYTIADRYHSIELEPTTECMLDKESFRKAKKEIGKNCINSYYITQMINQRDLVTIYASEYDFRDKKITCIGDSITYGTGGSELPDGSRISYCSYLTEILGCEVVNLGIGGTAMGDYWTEDSMILRWDTIPQDSDMIIIFAGVNDFLIGPECMGDLETDKTFCHDTHQVLSNIKEYYPDADIFVCTTFQNALEDWDEFDDYSMELFMEVIRNYAQELELNVIDLYSTEFLNAKNNKVEEQYTADGLHPNDRGSKILADRLAAELCEYYKKQEMD